MTSADIAKSIETSKWLWSLMRTSTQARLDQAVFSMRVLAWRADKVADKRWQLEQRLLTPRRERAIAALKRAEAVFCYGAAAWGAIAFELLGRRAP